MDETCKISSLKFPEAVNYRYTTLQSGIVLAFDLYPADFTIIIPVPPQKLIDQFQCRTGLPAEESSGYGPGGYHAAHLDDTLDIDGINVTSMDRGK